MVSGQRVKDWLQLAEQAMADNDPYGALRYMEEVMQLDSNRAVHNYNYAEALRMNNQYRKSAYYYQKIYRRDQGRFFPEAGPWLATMLKQSGDYSQSKATWRRVRDQNESDPEGYWYRKAVQEMRSCDLAALWMEEPAGFELEPAAGDVNTEGSEFAGAVTPGGHLVYTALRGTYDSKQRVVQGSEPYSAKLYMAQGPDWKRSRQLELFAGAHGEANFAMSEDSSYTALTLLKPDGRQEIHVAGGAFGPGFVRILPRADGDSAYYSHPAFGMHGEEEVLFFSSNREGGIGGLDLWYLPLGGGEAAPVNLGKPVNTPGNEIAPFYRKEKNNLYLSSDWHHGFGGFDLFYTGWNGRGFDMPQNMKRPWNTPSDDLYYRFGERSHSGTITSNRPEAVHRDNEGCCNDLWRFEEAAYEYTDTLYILTLEELNDYLPVTLYFHNDEPDPRTRATQTDQTYHETYYAYLDLLPDYQAEYRAGLDPEAGVEAEEAMDRFFLEEVDQGVRDLATFAPLLLQELREGQEIALTIKGFASPLAQTDYNVKLTSRRISSLENYLKQYEGGAFLPYLEGTATDGGRLDLVRIPFGEYTAQDYVSDNPNESNAIYSIAAALERKIEISSVQRAPSDTTLSVVKFDSEIVDLKDIKVGLPQDFVFSFEVEGGVAFVLDSLAYDPQLLEVEGPVASVSKGDRGQVRGKWLGVGPLGKTSMTITLYGNLPGGMRELNLVMEVGH